MILARVFWLVTLGLILWLMAWSLPYANLNLRFDQVISDSYNLFGERIGLSDFLRVLVAVQYAIALIYIFVGCVIFIRKPDDRIALLTSLGLVCIPYVGYFFGLVDQINPGGFSGSFLSLAESWASVVSIFAISLLLLTFPNGKIQPAWVSHTFRYLLLPLLLVFAGVASLDEAADLVGEMMWITGGAGFILTFGLGAFCQVYKYFRISSRLQRQQTKWVLFSLAIGVFWVIFNLANPGRNLPYQLRGYFGMVVVVLNLFVFGFIPVAFAVSLFRFRLYDIDLIVRRTLQYGLLTGLLVALYFVVIVSMQALLGPWIGQGRSPLVIVASTLSIAALFNPLRVRIQAFIDRRFFRSKYDTERILAAFGASVRSEVDLEQLSMSLLRVVHTTLQPDQASLWLKPEQPEKSGLKTGRNQNSGRPSA